MPKLVADSCHHFPLGIPEGHKCDARIVLVGEAPGQHEADQGVPFVGPSGYQLEKWWRKVGLKRNDFYITNVVPYRPKGNKIETVSRQELAAYSGELLARLESRTSPILVVPTGNTALHALTGKSGITKWRGSVLQSEVLGCKVIPTLHPAYALREPGIAKTCLLDWARIKADSKFPELRLPSRVHLIRPSKKDVHAFEMMVWEQVKKGGCLSIDIETGRDGIICVGFATSPDLSITLMFDEWREVIKRLCELPIQKILQNGLFDLFWLAWYGIQVKEFVWDPSCMFHALDPNAGPTSSSKDADDPNAGRSRIKPYSLAYMASIFTREPYWKDEAKDEGESTHSFERKSEEWWEVFLRYNGKDCCVTYELKDVLLGKLAEAGKLDFYKRHYSSLFYPILDTMLHGVRLDQLSAEEKARELVEKAAALKRKAAEIAGRPLHAVKQYKRRKDPTKPLVEEGKSISTKKLQTYLFGKKKDGGLGLKKITKDGKVTTNEVAIRKLRLRHPEHGTILDTVLEFRRIEKLGSFLLKGHLDSDGRVRCQYKFLVQTGRLSSASNPRGTGMNLQNIDRDLRSLFKPDLGTVFLKVDLSQAEARVVDVLTGDERMIEMARKRPEEFDVHKFNAALIFKKPENEVTKAERYLAKRGVHASHYGMAAKKLAEILLNDEHPKSIEECQVILDSYLDSMPGVREFQKRIQHTVIKDKKLSNSWGREIDFTYERITDELFRRAYAFIPQSEVGDLMNQGGYKALANYLRLRGLKSRINLQVHDELIVSCYPEELWEIASFLVASLERPRLYSISREYSKVELVIPAEVAISLNWGKEGQLEFKRFPDNPSDFCHTVYEWIRSQEADVEKDSLLSTNLFHLGNSS